MSQFLHNDNTKAIAISPVFSPKTVELKIISFESHEKLKSPSFQHFSIKSLIQFCEMSQNKNRLNPFPHNVTF